MSSSRKSAVLPSLSITPTKPVILITHPFSGSDKNYVAVEIDKVDEYLKSLGDVGACERTNPTEYNPQNVFNRVYVDIDGELPLDTTEKDFKRMDKSIRTKLLADPYITGPTSVCFSSRYANKDHKGNIKHKLSYSIGFTKLHGDKPSINYYVRNTFYPYLAKLLEGLIDVRISEPGSALKKGSASTLGSLLIDMAVYSIGGRKLRMAGQSKTFGNPITHHEHRPKIILHGTSTDTWPTYIPSDSVLLPTPISVSAVNLSEPIADSASVATTSTTNAEFPLTLDTDDERRDTLLQVIAGLGQARFDYYPDWIRLGFAMFNEGLTCDDYIAVSKVSNKWQTAESPAYTRDKWNRFKKTRSGITQSTLWRWLSHDNRELYDELFPKRNDFIRLLKNPSQAETARFFYNLKPDAYLYNESLKWFQLMPNNTWKNYTSAPSMLKADIWNTIQAVALECFSKLPKESDDEEVLKRAKLLMKTISKFSLSIGTSGFVDGIIQFLPSNYNNDKLPELMDESRHLLAFTDEVYDLNTLTHRKIAPSDYISINTGYAFPKSSNPEARKELLNTIRSMFETNEAIAASDELGEMTTAILHSISTCLHGRNKWERFNIWTGRGGNGKSLLADLVKKTLGDYFHPIPNSILTKPQDKRDATCGALYKAKGKRFLIASEPESQDRLQVGIIKELTGGDQITVRDLYKTCITYTPQFGTFMLVNDIPLLSRADGGAQRRIRVFPFIYSFVSNPTEPHHKLGNPDLKDKAAKSDEWRDEFIQLLIDAAAEIKKTQKLCEPAQVLNASKDYMDDNNPVRNWLTLNFDMGLDVRDRRLMYSASELLDMYEREKNHKIGPRIFKSCMLLCDLQDKQEPRAFETQRFNPDTGEYEYAMLKSGKYWLGLRQKLRKENSIE